MPDLHSGDTSLDCFQPVALHMLRLQHLCMHVA